MDTRPVTMARQSTPTTPARSRSATMTTTRRSSRSAIAPAHSPNTSQGRRCSSAASATSTALRVCEATSRGPAARAIPSPMLLTHEEPSSQRKLRPIRGGATTSRARLTGRQPTEPRPRRLAVFPVPGDFPIPARTAYDGRTTGRPFAMPVEFARFPATAGTRHTPVLHRDAPRKRSRPHGRVRGGSEAPGTQAATPSRPWITGNERKRDLGMAVVTMRQLLESGVHFGHQTRRWNPKMKRFIMTERNGIYIIDLQQSLTYINNAYEFVKETVAHGGTILFVGTKKQAQEPVAEQATRVGMPYVNHRWLGGMLTNFQTISKRLTRLKELEEINFDDVAGSGYAKKELLILKREMIKLEKTLGGIRTMAKVPSAVWIVDTKKEHLAVDEARKLGLPVIAILDTNCDPDEVDYKIPGNDDAIRSVTLLTRVIADAVADGLVQRSSGKSGGDAQAEEPLAEWERELYADASAGTETTEAPAAG